MIAMTDGAGKNETELILLDKGRDARQDFKFWETYSRLKKPRPSPSHANRR